MKVEEEACRARGFVNPSFVDIRSGKRRPFDMRHNKLSYMSAEAMAAAFGGDPSYIPARIGFIYGSSGISPAGEGEISRLQTWNMLKEEISASEDPSVDIQVVGFSYSPTLSGVDDEGESSSSGSDSGSDTHGVYDNILSTGSNAITFHAVSNSQDEGTAFGRAAFVADHYIYQAVLLGCHLNQYYVLSRVSLKDGSAYLQKPSGFEVALDWTVVFK